MAEMDNWRFGTAVAVRTENGLLSTWANRLVFPNDSLILKDNDEVEILFNSLMLTPQMFAPFGMNIAQGIEKPLSDVYASLGAAQVDFPFITALTQTVDYACVKACSNACFGPDKVSFTASYTRQPTTGSTQYILNDTTQTWVTDEHKGKLLYFRYANGFVATTAIASNTATQLVLNPGLPYGDYMIAGSACGYISGGVPGSIYECVAYDIGPMGEHGDALSALNKPMYLPGGRYMLKNDTWLIRDASGIKIFGQGRRSTQVCSNSWALAFDGLWYSQIANIEFVSLSATAGHGAVDIDGNVPGHPYATRSVQGNTWLDVTFNGGGSTYASATCRQGFSSAQGEQLFLNCYWREATCTYYQNGFNALGNLIIRGDMQDYTTGVYLVAGDVHVIGTTMESLRGYAQITDTSFVAQGGYDFDCSASGVNEPITIEGVRSESLRFFLGSSAQTGLLKGNQNTHGTDAGWTANVPAGYYTLGKSIIKNSATKGPKLYVVTTAGGSGATEPTWPDSGTVSDGTVVWTMVDFYNVNTPGRAQLTGNQWNPAGKVRIESLAETVLGFGQTIEVAANYTATINDELILVDSAGGNRIITLPIFDSGVSAVPPPRGKKYIIKKYDTSANTVTVQDDSGSGPDGAAYVISGGSRGTVTVELAGGGSLTRRYYVI